MSLGSMLKFPPRPDERGNFAVANTDDEIIKQLIVALIETRQGEIKMMPNYGMPDLLFDVLDGNFARKVAVFLREQIFNYIPSIEITQIETGTDVDSQFRPSAQPDAHIAAIRVSYTRRGQSEVQKFIYPAWRLIEQ